MPILREDQTESDDVSLQNIESKQEKTASKVKLNIRRKIEDIHDIKRLALESEDYIFYGD